LSNGTKFKKKDFVREYIARVDGFDNIDYDEMLREVRPLFKDWESKKDKDIIRWLKQYVYQISIEQEDPEYEKEFWKAVIVFLKNSKHEVEDGEPPQKCGGINQKIDVLSKKGGITYLTEVKGGVGNYRLQTGIGQLLFHQFGIEQKSGDLKNYAFQLAFPKLFETNKHFYHEFAKYLKNKAGIKIIFV